MSQLKRAAGIVLATLSLALFALAVIGNLFIGSVQEQATAAAVDTTASETAVWEAAYTEERQHSEAEAAAVLSENRAEQENQEYLKNQLAALRMMRDKSWQRLQSQLNELPDSEKLQRLEQNFLLQYQEQRLELLLAAKGFSNCLVVLEEKQANIIVAETEIENHYEKLYDVILRNSDYPAECIIVIPFASATERDADEQTANA